MKAPPYDAVIIGAGPAGSTAAVLLARAGWRVALVERQAFPRRKVCGECIAASNLPLLAALGLGPTLQAQAGPPLREVALMHGSRTVTAPLPPGEHPAHPWGRAWGREALDTALRDLAAAAGAELLQPWAAQAIEGTRGDWHCRLREVHGTGETELTTPVLIAAHGSWERLPGDRPQARTRRRDGDLFAFKANYRQVALPSGRLVVLAFDGGYGGLVEADDGLATLACCVRRDRLDAWRRAAPGLPAGEAAGLMLRAQCIGVDEALQPATRDGAWLAAGPLDPGIRLRPDDTMLRIGNAAGEAHPIVGEGLSMALQAGWMLAEQLLAEPARRRTDPAGWQAEVARAHAARWRAAFAPRLRVAATLAQLAMRPPAAGAAAALLTAWPSLLTRAAAWSGKTRCSVDADLHRAAPQHPPPRAEGSSP